MQIRLRCTFVLTCLLVLLIGDVGFADQTASEATKSIDPCDSFITAVNSGDVTQIEEYVRRNFVLPPNSPGIVASTAQQFLAMHREHPVLKIRKRDESTKTHPTVFAQDAKGGWINLTLGLQEEQSSIVSVSFGEAIAPVDLLPQQKIADAALKQKLEETFAELIAHNGFSGTVEIRRKGAKIYELQHGYRDTNRTKLIDAATRLNIASITKMFTAVAIARLVEQGKINWNSKVGDVLPDFANAEIARQVSVEQLLSHTSGIVGAGRTVNEHLMPFSARTVADSFGKAIEQPLQFRPGQQFDYSNFGYSILGRIIEQVSHQSYHDYIREHVFEPAGMTQTEFLDLDTAPNNYAVGFMDESGDKRKDNREVLSVLGMPYGGAYSNAEDLNHFYRALVDNKLLAEQTRKQMWQGIVEPEPDLQYGYGIQIRDYGGNRYYYHGGGWPGVTCQFEFCPELDYTLVLLSNYDINTRAIAYRLREWLTQGSAPSAIERSPTPKFIITAELLSKPIKVGEQIDVLVHIENQGAIAHGCIVDFEVKTEAGDKAEQQFNMQQRFDQNASRNYHYSWIPKETGTYTIDVGLFGSNWKPKYDFKHALIELKIAP